MSATTAAPAPAPLQAISEMSNSVTFEIDVSSDSDIVRRLEQSDEQMFSGWDVFPSMLDDACLQTIVGIAQASRELLDDTENNAIILSGSGTSGRFAFLTARCFNQVLRDQGKAPCYHYLCAGGDPALFMSKEAPEDNWKLGIQKLDAIASQKKRVLFVGITCGLSAPVVAGQLDYCLQRKDRITTVLLGFNPVERARAMPIEGWTKTFRDIVNEMLAIQAEETASGAKQSCYILVPVVGPEPITGSTRMKGGSATKILLDCIFSLAHSSETLESSSSGIDLASTMIQEFTVTMRYTYRSREQIASVMRLAGEALKTGGHVFYLGASEYGIFALVDASECTPTYNADPNDVRAFLQGGFDTLRNLDGDLEQLGPAYLLSWQSFASHFQPTLTAKDVIICLNGIQGSDAQMWELATACKEKGAKLAVITSSTQQLEIPELGWNARADVVLPSVHLSYSPSSTSLLHEFSYKLILNAISTGAHVIKGKVMHNFMIDLQVANNKLFYRSMGIIERFAKCDTNNARTALLKSIYLLNELTDEILNGEVSVHIAAASKIAKRGVGAIPLAVVLATIGSAVNVGFDALKKFPSVSQALAFIATQKGEGVE